MKSILLRKFLFAGFVLIFPTQLLAQYTNDYYINFNISGPTSVCPNGTTTYTYSGPSAALQWTVSGGQFVGSNYGSSVSVRWTSSTGSLSASGTENQQDCWYEPDIWPPVMYCNTDNYHYTSNSFTVNSELNTYSLTGGAYCAGGSGVNMTLSGSQVGVTYQLKINGSNIGGSVSGTGGQLNWGYQTAGGTYTVTGTKTSNGCTATIATVTVTIYAAPGSPTGNSNSRCGAGTVTLTASPGTDGNTVRWYSESAGGTLLFTGTSYTTPSLSGTTTYYISSYNSSTTCESTASRVPVTATINPVPASPTGDNGSRCGAETVTLTASPGSNGNTVRWYSALTGGTLLYTGTSYTTPSLSTTTTYYISSYNSSTTCESTASRVPVTATINPVPASPTGDNGSRCGAGTITLTASSGENGNTVRWYSTSTGGTLLYTGTSYTTPSLSTTTNYYISSYNSTTGCESTSARVPVTATITAVPSSPTGNNGSRCGTGTVTLTASQGTEGTTVRWYSALTGGTLLATATSYTTPSLTATTTYYISSYNSTTSCESTSARVPVTATIDAVPSSPTGNNGSRLGMGTVTLTASPGTNGTIVRWYSALTGGTLLATATSYTTPTLTANTTYYISSYNSTTGCESARIPVTATIIPNPPPSPDKNFIRIENVLVGGITQEDEIPGLTVFQKTTTYQYFDGLGRSLQTVTVKSSPTQGDFIQPFEYDQYGRQIKEYLPYTSSTETNGKFREDALTGAQSGYYTTPPAAVASTSVGAFKINTFEQSPLNRVTEVVAPRDDDWNGTPRKVTTYTKLNVANEVPLWKDFISGLPERNGFHAPNTLMVQETTDEEGKVTKVYNNLRGLTVMSRVGSGTEWFDTHFIYSPAGLKMLVIQPEGVARLTTEFDNASVAEKQSFLDRWAFQYLYDEEQREIAKRIPGYIEDTPEDEYKGWFFTVYDQWNRVVLTQDPDQRTRNEYLFSKYDRFNRPIITGLYVTATPLETLRTNANTSANRFETEQNNSTGYSLTSTFPTSGITETNLLTVTYYDNYAFLNYSGWDAQGNSFNFVNVSGYPQSSELLTSVKGHVTGSKVRMLGGDNRWLNSVTHYDKKYRPIQVISENHLGGILRTTSQFDFVGKVEKEQHYNSYSSLTIQNRYTYDHAGRQLTVHHQVNAQPEVLMVSNKYNELGQLIEKNIHSVDEGNTFLQSIDYRYNIKGWLTHINNTSFTQNWANDDTNDLFGMELQYYVQSPYAVGATGDLINQKSLYDGNISAIKWKSDNKQGTPEERIYVFDYDVLSRLKQAHYAKNTSTWSSPSWNGDSGMFDETIHGYDKNGNIKVTDGSSNPLTALTRYGRVQNSKAVIDQLKYGYRLNGKHSNRLIDMEDTGNASLGFKPSGNMPEDEYRYYKNGNLRFDHNQGISNILYNHLNLAKEVEFTRPGGQVDKMEYTYDATGNKLSQVVRINGGQVWKTDYVGGMQYDNGTLSFFITKEGRVVNNNNTFEYEYFHKDHQGNVRVVYGPLNETISYRATMENANTGVAQNEGAEFKNIVATRHTDPAFNYTKPSEQVVVPDKSARCNGYTGYSPVGPAKMLAVSTGDKVYMETYAKYNQVTGTSAVITATALISAFTSPFGIVNSGETATLYQSFNNNLPGISAGMGSSTTVPKAYLVWLFFDSNYAYVRSGGQAITTSAYNAFEKLSRSFTAEQNGYLYIYVTNESNASAAASVYFDETYIVHEKNNTTLQVLQASDYYPFGLSFNLYQADRLKETSPGNYAPELRNRYLFQGQELQKDLDLGWYQFKWRMHDPAIGRFGAVDPLSEKYVHNGTYVFSENKLIHAVELEGLESQVLFETMKYLSPIAFNFSLTEGTHRSGIGFEVSIGMPKILPFSYRRSFGTTYYGYDAIQKQSVTETRSGTETSYLGLLSLQSTKYSSGETSQTTGTITLGGPLMNVRTENDWIPNKITSMLDPMGFHPPNLGDGGDRFRTAAFKARIGMFSTGFNLATGDPGPPGQREVDPNQGGKFGLYLTNGVFNPDKYRLGVGYIGLGNFKIGVNSEKIRHNVQNQFHDLNAIGSPWFKIMPSNPQLFLEYSTSTGTGW